MTLVDQFGRTIDGISWTRNGRISAVENGNITSTTTGRDNQNFCRINNNWQNDCQQTPNAQNSTSALTIPTEYTVNDGVSGVNVSALSATGENNLDTEFTYRLATTQNAKYSNNLFEIRDGNLFVKNSHTTNYATKSEYLLKVEIIGDRGGYGVQDITVRVRPSMIPNNGTNQKPNDEYVTVNFLTDNRGTFDANAVTSYFVLKNSTVTLTTPNVTANTGYIFQNFENIPNTFTQDTNINALYEVKDVTVTHNFESVTAGKNLPNTIQTPSNILAKFFQAITPTAPTATEEADTNLDGIWRFLGYNPTEITVQNDGDNTNFVGQWEFTPNTHRATFSFADVDNLPSEVRTLLDGESAQEGVMGQVISPRNANFANVEIVDIARPDKMGIWTFQ